MHDNFTKKSESLVWRTELFVTTSPALPNSFLIYPCVWTGESWVYVYSRFRYSRHSLDIFLNSFFLYFHIYSLSVILTCLLFTHSFHFNFSLIPQFILQSLCIISVNTKHSYFFHFLFLSSP